MRLASCGELWSVDGELLTTFGLDGKVDVKSGVDLHGAAIAFTVELPSGGFAVVVSDISSGSVREVFRWSEYIGAARWSPDGSRLSLVGPDYRSIVVMSSQGELVETFVLKDSLVSGRVNAPRWVDDDRSPTSIQCSPCLTATSERGMST